MELVTPELGLSIWTAVAFIILLVILRVFAWKPILEAVNAREESISSALAAAEEAKKEMASLKASNEELLREANEERQKIITQAKALQDKMITEAKDKAKSEAEKIVADAKESITMEKAAAMTELKNHIASLSIEIAEKIVREQLSSSDKQKALAENLASEVTLN
ncbi:F0F1 ATP synthase subunit B [Luteibaculum oceani]|uniref:ATP synthase subunit b n=1 Tax=Luteibaculum oceani TaxID=1294296 RepID=A0A5C6VJ78_9FLAO|nr:F0F1 ATP synthase subunit B [Luteibaculum oceani]TXC85287.1 F0F1 ATP synthase subunit B [Luteibaculum oceani]